MKTTRLSKFTRLNEKKEKQTMKSRIIFHFLILAALVLSACTPAVAALPESGTTPSAEMTPPAVSTDTGSGQTVTGKCIRSSDEVRLLINSVHQYCLQYPAEYDVFYPNESEIKLIKRSMLNVSEPSVSINVQPADGMSVDQAADGFLAAYTFPESELVRVSLEIDEEKAIMLDKLPGQDIHREVFVVHNNDLYQLTFSPMDESQQEAYAQAQALFDTVIGSFNFHPESNACPDCPASEEDPGSAMISGWVWHDLCESGKDGQPAPVTTPPGCVKEDSPLGLYYADGVLAVEEPLIEGVVVTLGKGACPSTGLAEMPTITTDLSYSFSGLKAGTYCVSIDPQREPNFSILRPGEWTYPVVTQDVIGVTVTVMPGEYKGMVNFGWDYQFQP